MEPAQGIDFPLQLGPSLLGTRGAEEPAYEFCTLRYDFKPASVAGATEGQLEVQQASQKVLLQMGETAFAGRYEPCRDDGLDCVAVFDGTTFRLERLGAVAKNLRHTGSTGRSGAALQAGPSVDEVAARIDLAGALQGTEPALPPAAAAVAAAAPAAAADMDAGMSMLLESELFAALAGTGEGSPEAASPVAAAVGVEGLEAEGEEAAAGGGVETEHEMERADDGTDEEEQEGSSSGEEEQEEQEEGGGGGAQQGAAAPGAMPHPVLVPAPTLAVENMTEEERLFFGLG